MNEYATQQSGLIVANYGRHFLVESPSGERRICHSRGKKSEGVVGDRVLWQASRDEGTIEKIEPRRNLFYRRDEIRTKSFAANLDLVLVLIAAEPAFSSNQLSRALIAAEAEQIRPIIALNKSDLGNPFARAWDWLAPYRAMDYTVMPLSLRHSAGPDKERLLEHLQGKTTLVLGPSGAGKSTMINLLAQGASAQTGEISQALRAGKHTTTSTTWYWVDDAKSGALIDSTHRKLSLLQLHAPPRTRLRRASRGIAGVRPIRRQPGPVPDLYRVVRRVVAVELLSRAAGDQPSSRASVSNASKTIHMTTVRQTKPTMMRR